MPQEAKIKMPNLNGIIGKISSNAETIGTIYGVIADPIDAGRGLNGAIPYMTDRLSNWHVPNISKTIEQVQFYDKYRENIKNGAILWGVGELAKTLGVGTKYANLAQKFGKGVLKGTAMAAVLWLPAINPHGTSKYPSMHSNSISENFSNAPTTYGVYNY